MRIILERALFDTQSPAEATALVDLLSTAARDIYDHALLTSPLYVQGGDNHEIDTWLFFRSQSETDVFRRLLSNGPVAAAGVRSTPLSGPLVPLTLMTTQPRTWHFSGLLEIRVQRRPTSDWRNRLLTLPDAADLLREPVHLVLEDTQTDFAFLSHLAGPSNGAKLRALDARPGKIEIHGGGCGKIKKWLNDLNDGVQTSEKWRRMLRTWVLFDQDAGNLDAREPSVTALDIMKACENVVSAFGPGLSWICLPRREIESYVPDSGLRAQRPETQTFAQQIIDWRGDPSRTTWAWAMDLKKGLHGDRHPVWAAGMSDTDVAEVKQGKKPLLPHMLKSPFSSLSLQDVVALARGFGETLGIGLRANPSPAWTTDIPTEYDRGPIAQAPRFALVQSLFDRI